MTTFTRLTLSFLICLLLASSFKSQGFQPPASKASDRAEAFKKREALKESSPIHLEFTNVGPTIMSGRVVDIAVNPDTPSVFYVAYASGGLWKTINNGTTFSPIFDNEAVMTIGDFDVHWETGTIYVGTGEVNSSRSSYAGLGVYKSTDDGQNWTNVGLEDSHHIGKVMVSEDDPDVVIVGVLGHLYSDNEERGVFKSTDGGQTWNKTLFIDKRTGIVDIDSDPSDPTTLYAASWERERRAWNFVEAGEGSAIYKSSDNGDSWTKLTSGSSGFPTGENVGRIGLAVHADKIYALLDNYNRRPAEEKSDENKLDKEQLRNMSKDEFLSLKKELLNDYLKSNRFDRKYDADKVQLMVRNDEIQPIALVEFVEDANSLLFDTPVIGAEVYQSTDGGKSWEKTHDDYIEFVYNSYGYYFGMIEVAPYDSEKVYIAGVPILRSDDGGKNWTNINQENVHVDHHSLWINPDLPGHLINGNDGGVNISYDDGENWIKCNAPAVGQFYSVNVDQEDPYNIYGGAQDNGVWFGPSDYEASTRWHSTGQYPYESILGGDGMQVQIDRRNNDIVYAGLQFGNYYRINKKTGERSYLTPKHDLGERPYRWNWQAPILLSSHNQDVFYMGSNYLHRSMDQGENFTKISDDLTNGGKKGDVSYGTLSSISESPFRFGLLYTGSDDGVIQVSKDGGYKWERISNELPQDMWVSRVIASKHKEDRVYASLNGYRWDDFTPYLYVSQDYGATWSRLGMDLPHETINVVQEDPVDPNILYVGTDHGVYVSFDQGQTFTIYSNGLPAVPIHDLVIHEKEKEMVLGTHGRSFYKGSVAEIQKYNEVKSEDAYVFELDPVRKSSRWGSEPTIFNSNTEPEYRFTIYKKQSGPVNIEIKNEDGKIIQKLTKQVKSGISEVTYNLTSTEGKEKAEDGQYYLEKGKYLISIGDSEQEFEVK
ncbi:WD40/YVTN/BNR-like repeat-containing protein [Portibacter marinus]|uniref:WD40/YVTN/BNR-like repeat-containing protein n=1 Tax=Portibacter marinus TaxID=2898660 RepID=UPI001F344FEA|nr:glycosyl hydrolase [Portibacter marinus]